MVREQGGVTGVTFISLWLHATWDYMLTVVKSSLWWGVFISRKATPEMCIRYYYLVKQRTGEAGRKAAPQEAPQGPAGCIFISEGTAPLPFRHSVERTQAYFFDSVPLVAMEIVSHPPILKINK